MAAKLPSLIGNRYQILAPLGQGGMGIVYRALDRLRGQQIALKSISAATPSREAAASLKDVPKFSKSITAVPVQAYGDTGQASVPAEGEVAAPQVFVRSNAGS